MQALHFELDAPPQTARVPALPRVDLYGGVHRGLRYAHGKILARLAAISFADRASVELALDELEGILDLAAHHLAAEETHYHPALEARKPDASERLSEQHRSHEQSFAELRALAARLSAAAPDTAAAVGRALYLRYASFVAEDLAHMAEEELVALPLFHALYTEYELNELQATLVRDIPPRERSEFFRLIILASNHETRVTMLTRARAEMPAPGFAAFAESLRGELSDAEHGRLLAAL
jgi:hypothetical protein